jgi:hypothetical protein
MPSPDRGAAPERTVLARQRLAFSYVGLAAVFLGVAAHRELRWMLAVALALVAVAVVAWRERRPPALLAAFTAGAGACAIVGVLE